MHQYPNETEREELAALMQSERRIARAYARNPDPRDPDYPGDPEDFGEDYSEYVIQCESDPAMTWSNRDGWTGGDDYDTFTTDETKTMRLPLGGKWKQL